MLNRALFHRNVFLRGGITIGKMIHSGSVGLGPALTRAYDLESQIANYPRIVIDPDAADVIRQRPYTFDYRKHRRPLSEVKYLFRLDTDGLWFIDFMLFMHRSPEELDALDLNPLGGDPRPSLMPARTRIISLLTKYQSNMRIFPKYAWLARYYNELVLEMPEFKMEPILLQPIAGPASK